ncbi:MAG TPA: TrmH family RNA methyltransferase [Thermoanaerobaculia bacterium]|nr:TrmH family RNA methyltransferase [Thermoanaerobaculia bacterium]
MPRPQLTVVLVRPGNASNLGSVARATKNFGVSRLTLVEPAVAADEDSRRLAAGADDTLASLTRRASLVDALAGHETVIATSSLRGRAPLRAISLAELPGTLAALPEASRAALVFGPEQSGLTEEEIARATYLLRLPTTEAFPTMNLSHAVAVVLGAICAHDEAAQPPEPHSGERDPLAPAEDVELAVAHWDRALEAIDFYDTGHRDRSLRDWRRLIAARPLTQREVAILRGVANRILVALKRTT